jgi:hypothetical protein
VLAAVLFGAGLVGIIAITEGAALRWSNRKMRRELHKLETEVNLLRTAPVRASTASLTPPVEPAARAIAPAQRAEDLPSAPVYSGDEFDAYRDD